MPSPAVPSPLPSAMPGGLREPRDLSSLARGRRAFAPPAAEPPIGAVVFELATHADGVHVMRIHRRQDGTRVYCSVLFEDQRAFAGWLNSDTARFDHPLAFQQALRRFEQLMAEKGNHGTAPD